MTLPLEKTLYSEPISLPRNVPLPTMYELPSEDPEELGLPDDFHYFQPQLLRETFVPPSWPAEQVYVATDLNLYYDVHHTQHHKRPDWFAVLGVPRFDAHGQPRMSYVIWQERVVPFIVVELLSPGTEGEDLGHSPRPVSAPPGKWEVYEQFLRIPYYVVFSRYTHQWRVFQHQHNRYQEISPPHNRLWFPKLELGLGLWRGNYQGLERPWLRWYDTKLTWIPTLAEQKEQQQQHAEQERQRAEQEQQRAEQEQQRAEHERLRADQERLLAKQERLRADQERLRAEQLAAQLRKLGIEPEQ